MSDNNTVVYCEMVRGDGKLVRLHSYGGVWYNQDGRIVNEEGYPMNALTLYQEQKPGLTTEDKYYNEKFGVWSPYLSLMCVNGFSYVDDYPHEKISIPPEWFTRSLDFLTLNQSAKAFSAQIMWRKRAVKSPNRCRILSVQETRPQYDGEITAIELFEAVLHKIKPIIDSILQELKESYLLTNKSESIDIFKREYIWELKRSPVEYGSIHETVIVIFKYERGRFWPNIKVEASATTFRGMVNSKVDAVHLETVLKEAIWPSIYNRSYSEMLRNLQPQQSQQSTTSYSTEISQSDNHYQEYGPPEIRRTLDSPRERGDC